MRKWPYPRNEEFQNEFLVRSSYCMTNSMLVLIWKRKFDYLGIDSMVNCAKTCSSSHITTEAIVLVGKISTQQMSAESKLDRVYRPPREGSLFR